MGGLAGLEGAFVGWFDTGFRKTAARPVRLAQDRLTTNEVRGAEGWWVAGVSGGWW